MMRWGMKWGKRSFAFLMAMVILLSTLPQSSMNVFARADGSEETVTHDAITSVQPDDLITEPGKAVSETTQGCEEEAQDGTVTETTVGCEEEAREETVVETTEECEEEAREETVVETTGGCEEEAREETVVETTGGCEEEAQEETVTETTQECEVEEQEESVTETTVEETLVNLLERIEPQIEVKESYDTHILLTVSIGEDCQIPDAGNLFYLIHVVTHKSGDEKPMGQSYFFEKETGTSQDVRIEMNNGLMGAGEEWNYDIEVKLVQTKTNLVESIEEMESSIVCTSNVKQLTNLNVTPYYEEKLTLKKGTTTIYTSQKNVAIATIKFSKNTTHTDNIKVEDITYSKEENSQYALEFAEVGDDFIILANADEDTALGKHTIRVTADAPANMHAAQALITVNVVQGIEEGMLLLQTPSDRLYKAEGKSASLTFKVSYQADRDTNLVPKKKKVTWEILGEDGVALSYGDALYNKISVKNGKITVNKSFSPSKDEKENRFIVRATAADFEGNAVYADSEIVQITSGMELAGAVIIVKTGENGEFEVTAESNATITADKLGQVRLLKESAPKQSHYSKEELEEYTFLPMHLTYKSSNGAVKIDKEGFLTASKPVKNVKITVSTNDKSKQKGELKKLTVVYAKTEELALQIERLDNNGDSYLLGEIQASDANYDVECTADSRYKVTVVEKNDSNEWEEIDSYVNFKIAVSNGKIIQKNGAWKQSYVITTTKENLLIKLTDKSNKETITYNIHNTAYPKGKTPKVSAKGTIKAASYETEQRVTYTLKKNGKFIYDHVGKSVLITTDNTDKYKSDKNEAKYNAFEAALNTDGYIEIENGVFTLDFSTDSETPLPAGNYKLWFTFGKVNNSNAFIADTAPLAVTIKVKSVKTEKGTYTPNTSYKMAVKEGGRVELTGKGKRFLKETVTFLNIINANVDGGPNAFMDYFELEGNVLKIKDTLSEEELDYICSTSGKKDWTGYVDYTVSLANTDGSYSEQMGTTKITLTMKDSVRKFTAGTAKVNDEGSKAKINVYADKKKVNLLHGVATSGNYEVEAIENSVITLTPKTGAFQPTGGTNNVTIYVVPVGTFEPNRIKLETLKAAWENADDTTKAEAKEAYEGAVKKYGIKVTAKVQLPERKMENRSEAEQVVELVNKERAANGLKPLAIHEDLMYAASIRAEEIETYFSHTRPDGSPCYTILAELGIGYNAAGENIAMGQTSPEHVMDAWMNSSGHRANILSGNYTHIGVGCHEHNGRLYWVQMFIGTR